MSMWTKEELESVARNPDREATRNALLRLCGQKYPCNTASGEALFFSRRADPLVEARSDGFRVSHAGETLTNLSINEVLIWLKPEWRYYNNPREDEKNLMFFILVVLPLIGAALFVFLNLATSMQKINILDQQVDLIQKQVQQGK